MSQATVLIVEDGDEYLQNLTRFVPGPRYLQARGAKPALDLLVAEQIDVIYLDMRFDRLPREALVGDIDRLTRELGPERAHRQLENNQGLYILETLRQTQYGATPVILAYDFSREPERFDHLSQRHPALTWVPDAITPAEIRARIDRLVQR
ncbi:MAG TPA: hypothetical protein VJV78_18685 [Polyangiales bacterium]|nr:hypothetical protein [Polyangiales bacterium]